MSTILPSPISINPNGLSFDDFRKNYKPQPQEVINIETMGAELITPDYFITALYAYGHWMIANGTDPSTLQHPETYFNAGTDLEQFINVVNSWPKGVPSYLSPPTLSHMLRGLQYTPPNAPQTFIEILKASHARLFAWMEENNLDSANPNETKEERRKRKQREATARFRAKNNPDKAPPAAPQDSVLAELEENLSNAVADLRNTEKEFQLVTASYREHRDRTIAAAKEEFKQKYQQGKLYVQGKQDLVSKLRAEINYYSINK